MQFLLYVDDKEPMKVAEAGEKNEAEGEKSDKITIPDLSSVVIPDLGGVDGIVGALSEQLEKAKKEYFSDPKKLDSIFCASLSYYFLILELNYL